MTGETSTTKTIVLKPGESFTLPPGGNIVFTSDPNGLDSDCLVPPSSTYKCGYFLFVIDEDNNDGHPFDEDSCTIKRVLVKDVAYNINIIAHTVQPTLFPVAYPDGRPDLLNDALPDTSLFSFTAVKEQDYTKRKYLIVYFKVVDTYFNDTMLEIDERGDGASPGSPLLMYCKANEYACDQYDYSF